MMKLTEIEYNGKDELVLTFEDNSMIDVFPDFRLRTEKKREIRVQSIEMNQKGKITIKVRHYKKDKPLQLEILSPQELAQRICENGIV